MTKTMGPQHVARILGGLQKDPDFAAFATPEMDGRFLVFRTDVESLQIRCLSVAPEAPTDDEIDQRLERLHAATFGVLYRFRHFIERAKAALGTRQSAQESR